MARCEKEVTNCSLPALNSRARLCEQAAFPHTCVTALHPQASTSTLLLPPPLLLSLLPSHLPHFETPCLSAGAGADMRAWRLDWPPGFKLFEVDSETVLGFKRRVLAAAGPVFVDSLSVDRIEVVADASQPQGVCSGSV